MGLGGRSTIMQNRKLKKRIIELAYKHQLSHLGSALTSVDIINEIYMSKDPEDLFVLDNGHAYLAQCVVMEKMGMGDAEAMYLHHGTHPDKCSLCHVAVSSGSLGLAGSIAAGLAYKSPHQVRVLTSDGALSEGIWYETLNFVSRYHLLNYKLYINANGYGAYRKINLNELKNQLEPWRDGIEINLWDTSCELAQYHPVLEGQNAHYKIINEAEKNQLLSYLDRGYLDYEVS